MADAKVTQSPAWRASIALTVTVVAAAVLILVFSASAYLWIKAIHVIAIISWMTGMLYLPRLFVYHSEVPVGSAQSETFKIMEQRLLTLITNPAMVIAWVLGLWLAWQSGYWTAPWLHAKIALVVVLSGNLAYDRPGLVCNHGYEGKVLVRARYDDF